MSRPLRCAVVPPAPAPYREPLFAALHARDDLDLSVVYQSASQPSWDAAPGWFQSDHSYPARHLRSRQRSRPGRTPIVWPMGLERALDELQPDCVVATEYGPASLRVLAWCRRRRRAYVVFSDCTPQIDALLSPLQLRLHRWVARHADGMIAVSSAARERLLRFGVAPERIAVALQAGDLAPVRAAVAAAAEAGPGETSGAVAILSVGRLVPDKNFTTLIDAFARAGVAGAGARLEIAGTGFLDEELRQRAAARGVPVVFHGPVAPREMPKLYAAADVFALVSTYEPFGVAIREAVAAGLPVVCSATAGAAGDVAVGGENALLVDPTRVDDVAEALRRLVRDRPLRERLGARSRAVDAATDGRDVEAYAAAVHAAAGRRGLRPR